MRSIWAPGAIVAAYSMSSAVSGVQPHAHPLLMQLLRLDWSTAICVNLSRRERFPNVSWLNCARILGLCSLRRLSLLLCPYLYIPGPRGSGLRQALLWLREEDLSIGSISATYTTEAAYIEPTKVAVRYINSRSATYLFRSRRHSQRSVAGLGGKPVGWYHDLWCCHCTIKTSYTVHTSCYRCWQIEWLSSCVKWY